MFTLKLNARKLNARTYVVPEYQGGVQADPNSFHFPLQVI